MQFHMREIEPSHPFSLQRNVALVPLTDALTAVSRSSPATDGPSGASAGITPTSTNPSGRPPSEGVAGMFASAIAGIVMRPASARAVQAATP